MKSYTEYMSRGRYSQILDSVLDSKAMKAFLGSDNNKLDPSELAELITGSSSIDIKEKYRIIHEIQQLLLDDVNLFAYYIQEYNLIEIRSFDFKSAIDNLACAPGEFFTVDDPWYDEDIKEVKHSGYGNQPCADYNNVIEYIDWKYKYEEYDSDSCTWFVIKKWAPDEEGRFINTYIYYYIYGIGICWFAACREYGDEGPYSRLPEHKYSSACIDLNIATPFRAGDIVRIDCRPFAPPVNALILYAGPDWDCCSLLALYRDDKRHYHTGAVKHTNMWMHLIPDIMVSPLYRLEICKEELDEYDRIYKEISKLIYGDNKKGDEVWCFLSESRDFTSPGYLLERVKELFEEK